MFICSSCNSTFEKPDEARDFHGEYFGAPGYELIHTCPVCGDSAYSQAYSCTGCGELFSQADLSDGFCESCQESIISRFEEEFTPEERELILDIVC